MTTARRDELVDAAYRHVLAHGIGSLSLRPVAEAIGSSTGVLRFLFSSKDGLITAILGRARAEEHLLLADLEPGADLAQTAVQLWSWLSAAPRRPVLVLWVECYSASLTDPEGPHAGFARATVDDWLDLLGRTQTPRRRASAVGAAERSAVLALLRGCLLDLLATGDARRTTLAVRTGLSLLV